MESVPLDIDDELRVVTENSVWFVRPDTYCRMPRREAPRDVSGPELVDGVWPPTSAPGGSPTASARGSDCSHRTGPAAHLAS